MNTLPPSRLHIGAAYYPEHWPEERWPEDIRLMKEAGLTVVRMAEFAWSTMEPSEGRYRFDWLERAIALLAENGILTVLGTPTAAPPAWLVTKYPDSLAVDETGRRVQFGNRCHYCVNSPDFHAAVRRLVEAMAKRFGPNPHVIGWQIDNEYNRVCYCDTCRLEFQKFLRQKYGSLDHLNARWTTAYWSQTYSAWEQIPLPIGPHNPGLMLEFRRFVSASYRRFQKLQLDALRPRLKPSDWVTHNFMGWFGGFDHYELTADLDLAAWDWYIGSGHNDPLTKGVIHDLTRGFKRKNFWLMETQPGNVNWAGVNNSLYMGEAHAMAWHAVAHGADAVLYWQWRSALGGQEQYHGTLVDPSGRPRPFYQEAQWLAREFAAVSDLLSGSEVRARVAMLNDYDSRWSLEAQRHHRDFDYVEHFTHYYRPLAARNVNVDVLHADQPLDGYRLVIAPALAILNETRVRQLKAFVENGGHLVLTIRTGVKDEYNALLPSRPPGPLADLAGVEVEDYYALETPVPVQGEGLRGSSLLWAERLKPLAPECSVVARYGPCNGWLDGQPAITEREIGPGRVWYVGVNLDSAAQDKLMARILNAAEVPQIESPPGVEIRVRTRPDGTDIYIVINHNRYEAKIRLPWEGYEHLHKQAARGTLSLPSYSAAVLTREK